MSSYQGLDLLPDAVLVVGADGAVVHANAMAVRLLGVGSAADLVGKLGPEVLPLRMETGVDWWDCARPLEGDPALAPRLPEMDVALARDGHGTRPLTVTAARLHEGGTLTGVVVCLRRGERRQRADAARSDLVSTVSHEIRSPLTSVKGFTKTLLAKWDRFTDEQKRQMLATVNEDADRVTRLLTELLDVSRIDAGRVQLRRQMVHVPEIAQRVADRLAAQAVERTITCVLSEDLPRLYADPDKLDQIFTNLVENALKYAEGGIHVTATVEEHAVCFTVADEGDGIPEAQLGSIFAKFFRRSGERRSGTGLGLYISKGLAEAHGGRMWATSTLGAGSAFHFTLPRGGIELAGVPLERP